MAALVVCAVVASCEKNTKDQTQTDEELTVPAGAVDLGLDVYWVECNVGADKSQDYGDYYAWGEIEPEILGNGYWTDYKWAEME